MTRGGHTKVRDEPQRTCVVTRQSADKAELVRFVVGPDVSIVPDIAGKLPGRGIYIAPDRASIDKAVAKGLFNRAAKTRVDVAKDLADIVADLLRTRLMQSVALARKAGQAIAGFEKVKALLVSGEAVALFQASDGSEGMKSKLRPPNGPDSYAECLSAAELGVAFGRDTVIHAALTKGGLADLCLLDARRLRGFSVAEVAK